MPRDAGATRAAILRAAYAQFYRHGYGRVKMSDIAAAAGLTKRTLYHHFDSKDALLEAMLEDQAQLAAATFWRSISDGPDQAEALVGKVFEDLAAWSGAARWTGSGFTRLAMEMGDLPGHPAMLMADRHKTAIETMFGDRLEACGLGQARTVAREVVMLLEGAIVMVLLHRDPAYFADAAAAAALLVRARGG